MSIIHRIKSAFVAFRDAPLSAASTNNGTWYGSSGLQPGVATSSGERVTPESVLGITAYYASIRNIAEDIAKIPLLLFRRTGDKTRERATDHPLYRLLKDNPNPEMTSMDFYSTIVQLSQGWGNGYAAIQRSFTGEVEELIPLHPARIKPKRENNKLVYELRHDSGKTELIEPENMLHIKGLSGDGLVGYSILRIAADTFGFSQALTKFGNEFFANGCQFSGILTHPQSLDPKARDNLREGMQKLHSPVSGGQAHRFAILDEGMKYEKISVPPEEAQFLQTRQFTREEIAAWFRMPLHKIQAQPRAQGWSTLDAMNTDYVTDALMGWTTRLEQEISRKLLTPDEQEIYFAEHQLQALMRGDHKTRSEYYNKMFMMGALSPNDIRALENTEPIEDGDQYYIPANMIPAEQAGQEGNNGL